MKTLVTQSQRAEAALEVLARGGTAEAAARAGALDVRAVRAVTLAGPGAANTVLTSLVGLGDELARAEQTLRVAIAWPLAMVAVSVLSSAVVTQVALPALKRLPLGAAQTSSMPTTVALINSLVLFAALVLASRRLTSLGGWVSAWRSLDTWAFFSTTQALVRAQVTLPVAIRAGSVFVVPSRRAGLDALSRGLEAGTAQASLGAAVLGAVPSGLLVASAKSGTVGAAIDTLTTLAGSTLRRELPRDASRVATLALLVAGLSIGLAAVAFYSTYVRAVTG